MSSLDPTSTPSSMSREGRRLIVKFRYLVVKAKIDQKLKDLTPHSKSPHTAQNEYPQRTNPPKRVKRIDW